MLAIPATKTVEFCALFTWKTNAISQTSHSTSYCLLTTYNCA